MALFYTILDIFIHLNVYLDALVAQVGGWIYFILFAVVFSETGLVIAPFFPGDSLMFASGAIASRGGMNIFLITITLFAAAILGDSVNYAIGKFFGEKIVRHSSLIKKEHLDRTYRFFDRYGAKTIILCRFVPIVRTIAPFVAGAGAMTYRKFVKANIVGAALWVFPVTLAGYYFASVPFVEKNFGLVLVAVIAISFLPALYEAARSRGKSTTQAL